MGCQDKLPGEDGHEGEAAPVADAGRESGVKAVDHRRVIVRSHAEDVLSLSESGDAQNLEFMMREKYVRKATDIIIGKDPTGRHVDVGAFNSLAPDNEQMQVAVEMIRMIGLVDFKEQLGTFLDQNAQELAMYLINRGMGGEVARYLMLFPGIDHSIIARNLIFRGEEHQILRYRTAFNNLGKEIESLLRRMEQ
jgi:hypothetical protein